MGPQSDMILVLLDATALLWRLRLEGVDVGDRFERVADLWKAKLEDEAGYYAFNDVHAMMSFAATGRTGEIARLRRAMRNAAKGDRSNAAMTREVGLPLADGLLAFANKRYVEAIQAIEPVRDIAEPLWRQPCATRSADADDDRSIDSGRRSTAGSALHRRAANAQADGVERAVACALASCGPRLDA